MAVTLLRLSDGTTSLEFDREDWPAVRSAIVRRYGDIVVQKRSASDVVRFGGQSFWCPILEWEPNLFAATAEGAAMLEDIATMFGNGGKWAPTPLYGDPHRPPTKRRLPKVIAGTVFALAIIAFALA